MKCVIVITFVVIVGFTPMNHCNPQKGKLLNESVPLEDFHGMMVPSSCSMYKNFTISNETVACTTGRTYYTESISTIVSQVSSYFDNRQIKIRSRNEPACIPIMCLITCARYKVYGSTVRIRIVARVRKNILISLI